MATTLYLRNATLNDWISGNNDARLNGAASFWNNQFLSTTRSVTTTSTLSTNTVAGPTPGIEALQFGTDAIAWISPPIDVAITISGSITWNIWAAESSASANVAINGRLEVIDGATGAITLIDATARITEVALTTRAVNNFAETPAAGVLCKRGDRLRVRVYADDAGTMGTGFTFSISWNGATAAVDGDTWLQLTETLTFAAEPAGTQIFPTDTASAVSTASVDREAWTSRGAGVQTDVTNTVAGFTAPIQITDTAGGTVVDWFTRPLVGFTLGGAVRVNVRDSMSAASQFHGIACEIARVAADGTGATVWGKTTSQSQAPGTTEAATSFLVSGTDLVVSAGQCLRIRFYLDDAQGTALAAGQTHTLYYAGAAGATGDTFLTFTQALAEFVAPPGPRVSPYPQILAH